MEKPVLRIDHLTVRYGKTCGYCRTRYLRVRIPVLTVRRCGPVTM